MGVVHRFHELECYVSSLRNQALLVRYSRDSPTITLGALTAASSLDLLNLIHLIFASIISSSENISLGPRKHELVSVPHITPTVLSIAFEIDTRAGVEPLDLRDPDR
jgi:hypothetical protein